MFLKHTIPTIASHTHTITYKQLYMQACYAGDIAQCSAAIKPDSCNITIYIQEVQEITGWIHVNKEI